MNETEQTKALLEWLTSLLEMFSALPAAAAGYRAECLKQGFGPEAAEEMAVAYHQHVQEYLWEQITAGSS